MSDTDRIPEMTPYGRLRTNWQAVCAVISVTIAAAIWATVLYSDVQALKAQSAKTQEILDTLARQVDRLNWTINPPIGTLGNPHHGGTP